MNDKKHLGLVRKPSGAVENAAPVAKRTLPAMVCDTLNLARKTASKEIRVADSQLENWFRTGEKYYYGRGVPKDHSEAVKWYRKAADRGYALAQYTLSRCYAFGEGVVQSRLDMLAWVRKAAEGGQPEAQWFLGKYYQHGDGVPQDHVEAAKWYRKSAERGYAVAQDFLGGCYEVGRGVPQDLTEAAVWYRRAAAAGYLGGVLSLARCYLDGIGVAKDCAEGIRMLKPLAEAQDPGARYLLGLCHLHGKGFQRNPDEACRCFAFAALQGNKAAATELELLIAGILTEKGLTKKEVIEALPKLDKEKIIASLNSIKGKVKPGKRDSFIYKSNKFFPKK